MLAAYLEAEVTPSEAAAVEEQLAGSATARRRLDALRQIRSALAAPIPELESVDVSAPVLAEIARARAATPPPARWPGRAARTWRAATLAAAACAVGAAAAAAIFLARPGTEEFRAKSAAPPSLGAGERWAGVQAYHVAAGGQPERLGARLAAGDGLLFAYTNLGPRPFGYLMIFAVDARGAVRWCHPAYERAGTDPRSIPLRPGEAGVPLAEVIHHDFASGPLELRALFSMRPLGVLEVEAWLAGRPPPAAALPFPDAFLQVIDTQVVGAEGPR
jgi:hypothetical protein